MPARECSRTACSRPAVSTLTYVYADSTAVLGPLAATSEPHTYDLCREHSAGLTVPLGWRVIRVAGTAEGTDDLVALAEAVRADRQDRDVPGPPARRGEGAPPSPRTAHRLEQAGRTGTDRHLHVVRNPHD